MSRHGYIEDGDCEDYLAAGRWKAQLKSATRGKRGQAFFRALLEALDAMPEKRLVASELETPGGEVCALGCLGKARGVDFSAFAGERDEDEDWEDYDWDKLAEMFDIAPQLAREVMYQNDEAYAKTADERWRKVRGWVARQIKVYAAPLDG
jgi:hypothetical protein